MTAALAVIDPGPFATIQDLGRRGYQRYGVSGSGAMDELSFRLANMLVGNLPEEAAVEFTFAGGIYQVEADRCRLAVAGGDFPIQIDGAPATGYRSYTLRRGARLTIGRAAAGMRGYLAVAGGFDIAPVLDSRSTHTRAAFGGLEGGLLKRSAVLPLRSKTSVGGPDLMLDPAYWPKPRDAVRVVLGPQDDHFTPAGRQTFLGSDYRVSGQSDRMGYRLEGPPIEHADDYNIISDGIAIGSIQVPGSCLPIVLLADRQPTGGYPKIATVISADLPVLAQKRPGDAIRFVAVTVEEAEDLRLDMLQELRRLEGSLLPVAADAATMSSERLLAVNLISGVVGASRPSEIG
jgi:biotin-dependent carboxylase-like uncharacterized protein